MQIPPKKIIICGNISLVIAFWYWTQLLRQFYPGVLANFAGSTIIFFIAALVIQWFYELLNCRDGPSCCPFYWQPCLIVWSFLFLFFPQFFSTLFRCKKFMSGSFNEVRFLGKLFLGVSSKFLRNSKGNSYCKKDYIKGEINVIKITQIRLQKKRKNIVVTSFYCFVCKIWKKIVFYVVIRRGKKPGLSCFLYAKRLTWHFYAGL